MAKIYLKARKEPMVVDNSTARDLNEQWLSGKLTGVVSVEGNTFEARDLRGIEGVVANWEDDKIDLDNPEHRKIVREFEREFLSFIENNPEKYLKEVTGPNGTWKIGFREYWCESLGIIKFKHPKESPLYLCDIEILSPNLYGKFEKKWSAFQELRYRREKAKCFEGIVCGRPGVCGICPEEKQQASRHRTALLDSKR